MPQTQKELPEPVAKKKMEKISTGSIGKDRLLGGGMARGCVHFKIADSGTGKTTDAFQMGAFQQKHGHKVFFFTGEEPLEQINERVERLGITEFQPKVFYDKTLLEIKEIVRNNPPDVMIVDSLQTLTSPHMRLSSKDAQTSAMLQLKNLSEAYNIATWVIGHTNKNLKFASSQALKHFCTVLIEAHRGINGEVILSTPEKNRLGPTGQRAVFRMTEKGLVEKDELETGYILRHATPSVIGVAAFIVKVRHELTADEITVTTHEKDALLLVGGSNNHAMFLSTVIQTHFHGFQPNFVARANLSERLTKNSDLAVIVAMLSFFHRKPIPRDTAFIASVDGSGRLLPTPDMDAMVQRAKEQGYSRVFGAVPIGSQAATWETADTVKEVWQMLGF